MKHFVAALFLAVAATASAAQPPSPSAQPLLVVHAPDPGRVDDVMATAPLRELGMEDMDYSGRLPGLGAEVDSLRDLLDWLSREGARDFWFCLSQGRTIIQQTAGMGWLLPAGQEGWSAETHAARLEEAGLETNKLRLRPAPAAAGINIVAARDDKTAKAMTGGGEAGRWRQALERFVQDSGKAVGVWLNPRPLIGLASLVGGPDPRALLTRLGLNVPESLSLALLPDGRELGFALRLDRILPRAAVAEPTGLELFTRPDAMVEVHMPQAALLEFLPALDTTVLAVLNLRADVMTPRAASAAAWREDDGMHWLAGALFADGDGFGREWEKVLAYAEALGADNALLALDSDGFVHLYAAGRSMVLRCIRLADGAAVLFAGAAAEDLPESVTLKPRQNDALAWRIALDEAARADVVQALWSLEAADGRTAITAAGWDAMLPAADSGTLRLDGDAVELTAATALLPLLATAWPELRHTWRLPSPE